VRAEGLRSQFVLAFECYESTESLPCDFCSGRLISIECSSYGVPGWDYFRYRYRFRNSTNFRSREFLFL